MVAMDNRGHKGQPGLPLETSFFKPGDRVGIAVSGGADSVALLRALHAANLAGRNALGLGLSVVHVHHGIRGAAADEDAEFVAELAAELDVPLHLHRADVPARAQAQKETLEEAARNVRYAFFQELMVTGGPNARATGGPDAIATGGLDAVATAHTLDDQAETVLMKLLRGAWTEGLGGISPVVLGADGGRVVRPLLGVRRAEVVSYLQSIGQPWREDATNQDTAHTRNRVRHELMPALRGFNPRVDEALAHVAELARGDEARWQLELARVLPQVLLPGKPVRGGGRAVSTQPGERSLAIELERLRAMDAALRRRVLRAAAEQLGQPLDFDSTARLLALCGLDAARLAVGGTVAARTGSSLHLPRGLRAERSARELRLWREVDVE